MTNAVIKIRDLNLELESLKARKAAIKQKLTEHRDTITPADNVEAQEIKENIERVKTELRTAQESAKNENKEKRNMELDKIEMRDIKKEEIEKRAAALKKGETVNVEYRTIASTSTALKTEASSNINPAFAQVSSIDQLVKTVDMQGGEAYKSAFEKTIATGGITAEGANYTDAEPEFAYATINKIKITAYAEINEEAVKLPSANYEAKVSEAVRVSLRKKMVQQILAGTGTSQFQGIIGCPATIIEASQTKTIATLTADFIDDIIYAYGGDENVEGDAYLIMNKLTLGQLAKVRGTNEKRRVFDIKLNGNTGTIDGIPFVLTSNLPAYSATLTKDQPYCLYGKLTGYEVAIFSPVEIAKSTDYKFKQGQIAYKASVLCGGSPAMWNGFMTIRRTTT